MKRCLLISIVVLCMVASNTPAQISPLPDHYYAYTLLQPIPFPAGAEPVVQLSDQWGTTAPLRLGALEKFSNPADKDGGGIFNFDLHYTWYRFDEPNPGRIVQIKNQFDPADGTAQILFVGDAKYLLAPSSKDTGEPLTILANHYKCYDAQGPSADRNVILQDQWGTSNPLILEPVCFCNPVAKDHDGILFPIEDPFAHLTCYRVLDGHFGRPALIWDQFLQGVTISDSDPCVLCVPTDKLSTVPTRDSTWGQIKSLYK